MAIIGHRILGALAACAIVGCGNGTTNTNDAGQDAGNTAGGTCSTPIDLTALRMGSTATYSGTTNGRMNTLHPYGGCVATDAEEVVFSYTPSATAQAIKVTTAGSDFDTVLYARTSCEQVAMDGADLACNNDNYDGAPASTIYLTDFMPDMPIFIVADGNASMDAMGSSSGNLVLTVTEVTFGTAGNPCHPMMEGSTAPRCDAPLACSEGGSPDGTALCVPTVANGAMCDSRGFTNTCTSPSRCVTDPSPPDGMAAPAVCAAPGTAAGAPCRMTMPQCDANLACGSGDTPVCVHIVAMGNPCDPTGQSNKCAMGMTCGPLGSGGPDICH